ncbi:glutathione S-transferase [Stipitochalara longipes BDJ]|nr:glutathione S-transferase [Stipitochalara longipes BDJ]
MSSPTIHLYTTLTPNGIKISILLEELGLPYEFTKIDISKNTQKEPWFLAINPNGRIPALTDTFEDGQKINLWESGSIMQYLVDRYDTDHKVSYPRGTRLAWELFFQNAGVGPTNHFTRYVPERIEYGVNRYQNETRRLYRVLNTQLEKSTSGYLVGNKATIADFAHYGRVSSASWAGVDINEFPELKAWKERMYARPGVKKGAEIPEPPNRDDDPKTLEEIAKANREWIQAGMKADAKK